MCVCVPEAASRGLVCGCCSVAKQNQHGPSGTLRSPGGGRHAKCEPCGCTSPSGEGKRHALDSNALVAANCNLRPVKAKLPGTWSCLRVCFRTQIINVNEYSLTLHR